MWMQALSRSDRQCLWMLSLDKLPTEVCLKALSQVYKVDLRRQILRLRRDAPCDVECSSDKCWNQGGHLLQGMLLWMSYLAAAVALRGGMSCPR